MTQTVSMHGGALEEKGFFSDLKLMVQSVIAFLVGLFFLCIGLIIMIILIVGILTDFVSETFFQLDPYTIFVNVGAIALGVLSVIMGIRYVRFAVGKYPQS